MGFCCTHTNKVATLAFIQSSRVDEKAVFFYFFGVGNAVGGK